MNFELKSYRLAASSQRVKMRRTLQRRAIPAGYKEKASALVRFDYAGRYFKLSHLKRFCRRVCKILLGPIMWSCYVLIMRSPEIGICKKRLRSNGNRDIILPSAAGPRQPLYFSPAHLLGCNPQIPKKWRYFWNIIQKIGDNFGIRT